MRKLGFATFGGFLCLASLACGGGSSGSAAKFCAAYEELGQDAEIAIRSGAPNLAAAREDDEIRDDLKDLESSAPDEIKDAASDYADAFGKSLGSPKARAAIAEITAFRVDDC
jgi:hypothetical protein